MPVESAPVNPGDILADKYKVDRVLGIGGMGVVVQAHHLQLEERVAIKFLLPDALENEEAVARFAREARAAVKIKSEHVARVIDVGSLSNKAPYMVMEFLEGEDLGHVIERGAVAIDDAVDYVLQACEAIAEAHSLGIVHRDLKPANLFLIRRADGSRCVKVLDFGISKVVSPGSSDQNMSMTKTTAVMGSPLYMSPEQMRSARYTDARSDIWSLGVILYELLTGDVPFKGESVPELCMAVLTEEPPFASARRPEVPAGLDDVVRKCLARDATNRYQNVGELAVALVEFAPRRARLSAQRASSIIRAASMQDGALPAVVDSAPPPPGPPRGGPTIASWGSTTKGSTGGKRRLAIAGATLAVVAVGVGSFVMFRAPRNTASAHEDPAKIASQPVAVAPQPAEVLPTAKPPIEVAPIVTPAEPSATATEIAPAVASASTSKVVAPKAQKPKAVTSKPTTHGTSEPKSAAEVFDGRK